MIGHHTCRNRIGYCCDGCTPCNASRIYIHQEQRMVQGHTISCRPVDTGFPTLVPKEGITVTDHGFESRLAVHEQCMLHKNMRLHRAMDACKRCRDSMHHRSKLGWPQSVYCHILAHSDGSRSHSEAVHLSDAWPHGSSLCGALQATSGVPLHPTDDITLRTPNEPHACLTLQAILFCDAKLC
jgi:hypothetical protein